MIKVAQPSLIIYSDPNRSSSLFPELFRRYIQASFRQIQSFRSLEDPSAYGLHSEKFRSYIEVLLSDIDLAAQQNAGDESIIKLLEFQYGRILQLGKYWHICEISQFYDTIFVSMEFMRWLKVEITTRTFFL